MKIGIIGLGYVGLTFAIAAADAGIEVYGVEVNKKIKECLNENRAHFFEPGLNVLIKKYNHKNFFVVDKFPKDATFDAFIITVGTPLKYEEKKPNFDYIRSALNSIQEVYTGKELIVLRSTVSVGTARNVIIPELTKMTNLSSEEVLVSMCPERTVEGKAILELRTLPQIISGNNEQAIGIAQKLFRKITPYVVEAQNLEEAELAKLYCNTYRDMTFALGNVFCMAAQTFNVNGSHVIELSNRGYDRANICLPGFVAGPCLEKDAYILTNNMPECASKNFIMQARRFNESLEDMVIEWVENKIGKGDGNKTVALSGMTFKGQPETSDLRGSTSVYIAQKLKDKDYLLKIHDYVADREEMEALNVGEYAGTVYDAAKNADLLLVLNNHKKYADLSKDEIQTNAEIPILDAWGSCKNLKEEYHNIWDLGNFKINQ